MEKESDIPGANSNRINWFKWLFLSSLVLLLVFVYMNYSDRRADEEKFRKRSGELTGLIDSLRQAKSHLESEINSRDILLTGYASYLPLIKNIRLTDTAYRALPYRYGQRVKILPDSSDGVINSITVTANDLEYSVKYNVRNRKGELIALSVSDIMVADSR